MPEVFKVEVGGEDLIGPGEVIAAVAFAGVLKGRARHQGHRRVDPAAGPVKSRIHVSIIAAGRPSLLKTCTPGGREMEKLTINPMQPDFASWYVLDTDFKTSLGVLSLYRKR